MDSGHGTGADSRSGGVVTDHWAAGGNLLRRIPAPGKIRAPKQLAHASRASSGVRLGELAKRGKFSCAQRTAICKRVVVSPAPAWKSFRPVRSRTSLQARDAPFFQSRDT